MNKHFWSSSFGSVRLVGVLAAIITLIVMNIAARAEEESQTETVSSDELVQDAKNYAEEVQSDIAKKKLDKAFKSYRRAAKTFKSFKKDDLLKALDDSTFSSLKKLGTEGRAVICPAEQELRFRTRHPREPF